MNKLKQTMKFLILSAIISLSAATCQQNKYPDLEDGLYAEIVTTKGTMVAQLNYDKAPVTVANFVTLSEGTNSKVDSIYAGKKFYNGLIFHRVMDGFMIQGGDPLANGRGNPGYKFNDEINEDKHDKPGVLSMANAGPGTNGSQFFIMEKPWPSLNPKHTVFGQVVIGMAVRDSIAKVEVSKDRATLNKPLVDVVINEVNIIRKGAEANKFDAVKTFEGYFVEIDAKNKKKAELAVKTKEAFDALKEKSTVLPSGLEYVITEAGSGKKVGKSGQANVHYAVYFADGKILETSKLETAEKYGTVNEGRKAANQYQPIKADVRPEARAIAGFKEGIQQLKVGDKATLFVPSHLAYGERGNRGIPPNTDLVFEIEVVELVK